MSELCLTRPIPGPGIGMLRDSGHELRMNDEDRLLSREELTELVSGCAGMLTQLADPVDADLMDAAGPQLKVISNYAVGFNNIDVDAATERGVAVCNTPDVLTEATADIAWTLLLGVARRAAEGDWMMREGRFTGWAPHLLLGGELHGRTLAIIGAGRIGYATARRATGWNMRILYVARSRHEDFEHNLGAERVGLDESLERADFVSLHVPLTDQTRHLIGPERLARMKRSAYLVNTSRGAVIDEEALVEALADGTIAGAGLDVYEDEPRMAPGLADRPNTLLLPHLGSATEATRSAMSELAARNLLRALDGDLPEATVNAEGLGRAGGR